MTNMNADLWNDKKKKFNKDNLQILINRITGKPNATMDDVEALFSGDPIYTNAATPEASGVGDPNGTYSQEYGSKVVKSYLLNGNAYKITPGRGCNNRAKGLCVKLKGKEFCVTSLTRTLPTIENPNGDIVATLLLKNQEISKQWNMNCGHGCLNAEPSNMYGTSYIRKALIGKNGWQESFIGSDIDFAARYLVKPKYIGYQQEQSIATRWQEEYSYSLPNDALGDVGGYYNGYDYYDNAVSYDYYNNGGIEGSAEQKAKRNAYIAWGDDYVWLPSVLEISSQEHTHGIWELQWSYEICESSRHVWTRSGNECDSDYVYGLDSEWYKSICKVNHVSNEESACSDHGVTIPESSGYMCPAMHLNLTAVADSLNSVSVKTGVTADVKRETDKAIVHETDAASELWNAQKQKFNRHNLQNLLNHITGKNNASMHDVAALLSGEPISTTPALKGAQSVNTGGTYHLQFGSKVVKSAMLNNNANQLTPTIGNDDNGLTVTLKGKEFLVTSLTSTMPTDEDPYGDIVATLLLKEPEGQSVYSAHDSRIGTSDEPSNMYGTSHIRKRVLPAWLSEFVGHDVDFAADYLVRPKRIGYQNQQSIASEEEYGLPNDALGNVGGFCDGYDYYNNGNEVKREKYISWGEDFVWLPSLLEIVGVNHFSNIWGMDKKQIGFRNHNNVWLRSGCVDGYDDAIRLDSSGNYNYFSDGYYFCYVMACGGLRPALHLNLSAATNN